jgi:hypothetical protein
MHNGSGAASPAAIYKSHAPPDARSYLSIVDCPAFLQAVADGNTGAVEEFHNDGVGKLNKVTTISIDYINFLNSIAGDNQLL